MFASLGAIVTGACTLVFSGFFFCIGFLLAKFTWDVSKGIASEATLRAAEY